MKAEGPTLVVDAGNALFRSTGLNEQDDRKRAELILNAMGGRLGTQAMAVGARDLDAGPLWLKELAAKAKLPLLSANLVDDKGKLFFPASMVVEVGGKKIGLIGVSPASPKDGTSGPPDLLGGAKGLPIAPAVIAEAKKLRTKTDLIVVLAAVPYADSLQLSRDAGTNVDFIIQSHEGRGQGAAQRGEGNFVLPAGERGRLVGKLTLDLSKSGAFIDAQEIDRDQQTLKILDQQVGEVQQRLAKATDAETKKQLQQTLGVFQERQKEVKGRVEAARKGGGRTMSLDWMTLTSEYTEDPALDAEVKRIEPNGAPQH